MSKQRKRISKTIAKLLIDRGFYAQILLSLKKVESRTALPFPTMGTDGRILIYDPDFVDKCSNEELLAVLCHEATHIAAMHPIRRQGRDVMLWNYACDTEVNEVVVNKEGLVLPEGSIPGEAGVAEAHYAKLKEEQDKHGYNCKGDGWKCVIMPPKLGPGETWEDVRAEIEENVRRAHITAKMWGQVPEGLAKMLDELLIPKLKWEEILRRFVETKFEPQIQWESPNRRHLHRGIILPGNGRRRTVAEVALAIDTSGSISERELLRACTEVRGVLEDCYDSTTVLPLIWFDAAAYLDYISIDDDFEPKGGGGTDFAVVMECFEENEMDQGGLVIITDGYCGNFGEEPRIPVLWVVFGDYAEEFEPPFGEVVKLEVD